jgi:ABC-type branched-subunit amino acid transport system substrate-binding protein
VRSAALLGLDEGRQIVTRLALIALLVVPLGAVANNPDGVFDKEIILGSPAAYRGQAAGLGTEQLIGSLVYFEHINQRGGVHGRKIKVIAYDDDYNPKPTVTAALRLLEKDKVFALFDSVGTPTIVELLPVLKRFEGAGAVLFGNFTGAQPQREPPYDKIVFNVRASYRQEVATAVDFFVDKLGCTKVCGYWQNDAYGWSGRDGTLRRLKARSMQLVKDTTYERGSLFDADYSKQVTSLKDAGCQCVVMVGAYQGCGGMIRQAREAGWYVPMHNVSFVGPTQMLKLLREHEKQTGKTITDNLINTQVVPNFSDTSYPIVKEYRELRAKHPALTLPTTFKDCCGPKPETWSVADYSFGQLEGFINAKLFVEILQKAGRDVTREKFKTVANSYAADLGGFKGKYGTDASLPDKPANQFANQVYVTYVKPGATDWLTTADWGQVLSRRSK